MSHHPTGSSNSNSQSSPPPPPPSLAHKLELLEARFTAPLSVQQQQDQNSTSSPATAIATGGIGGGREPVGAHSTTTTATTSTRTAVDDLHGSAMTTMAAVAAAPGSAYSSPSGRYREKEGNDDDDEATTHVTSAAASPHAFGSNMGGSNLGGAGIGGSSSVLSFLHNSMMMNTAAATTTTHSFQFDPPSNLSRSALVAASAGGGGGSGGGLQAASPSSSSRQQQQQPFVPPPTTEQVMAAAEQQIARVAARGVITAGAASSNVNSSSSQGGGETNGVVVVRVQETPPPPPSLALTSAGAGSVQGAAATKADSRMGATDTSNAAQGTSRSSNKRKQAAPVKKQDASVLGGAAFTKSSVSSSAASESNHAAVAPPPPHPVDKGPSSATTAAAATIAAASRKRAKREPLRDRRASPLHAAIDNSNSRHCRSSPPGSGPTAMASTSTSAMSSPSRRRNAPKATGPALDRTTKAHQEPAANAAASAGAAPIGGGGGGGATIYDYFSIKSRTNQRRNRTRSSTNNDEDDDGSGPGSSTNQNANNQLDRGEAPGRRRRVGEAPTKAGSRETSVSSSVSSSPSRQVIIDLQAQVTKLQEELHDKEGQLRAIQNSRSVLHSALQSTLAAREGELRAAEDALGETRRKYRASLEKFVRDQSAHEAKAVRDQLAVDGARLGRIIMTRAGLRSVEAWEDGLAFKQLRQRKKDLAAQAAVTKERQAQAQTLSVASAPPASLSSSTSPSIQGTTSPSPMLPPSSAAMTPIEVANVLASAELHLANLHRQQSDLEQQEKELQLEKTVHIRALKRVSSEDSSRFRNRPKLHDRYLLRSLLGKGGFSEVWKAYDLVELREVAVKIHQLDPRWSDAKKESFTKHVSREYEIHRGVRHPRIVSLFDVFEIDINSFATVLECCHGTDLDTLLKERRTLPETEARAILLQILVGMQYLSQPSADGSRQGIIHYDLKPGNILFDEFGDAKITDFGLSKIVEADSAGSMELTSQGAGTYWYLPPECFVMDEKVRISNKVDVWAIGVIFYQMLFGRRPFGDGMSQDKLLSDQTMLNARSVPFPSNVGAAAISSGGRDFIQACLQYDQDDRPSMAQLCEHPYVVSRVI